MDPMHFTFSDTIAGYVQSFEWEKGAKFVIATPDGREFEVAVGDNCYAELARNLGGAYQDCTGQIKDMLAPGRFLFAYGVFYREGDAWNFEAKHLVFLGRTETEFAFERQDWWIQQVRQLGDFYLKAQFNNGEPDFRKYRTQLELTAEQTGNARQECDTISRLVYGFASAYLMTGDDRYLDAAEAGTQYLRDHFRAVDGSEGTCYWYHAIDVVGDRERKVFASEFGDDYDAIPAYEQIYALAGPTQTLRATGDPAIEADIQSTINLFQKHFLDRNLGGYFSHVDPITMDPRSESLERNRARKNWNSVGDHAPAYLINAVLATGDEDWAAMLEYCADTITAHFPDYENSPFVNEKFHEDWSHDQTWGWQQNRAVVGHNLKIAWNLMRIQSMFAKDEYVAFARRIAELMPLHGKDVQRCGWYDVVSRVLEPGQEWHRYAWHDRKAWWQQEQGILAYLILAGVLGDAAYLQEARESASFYNAWFLDHDSGGVYFNVLANGLPYLLGTERQKGSHSMSGYHSFELCYLAAVYSNLLVTKQPMDFYFKPLPNGCRDRVLRVAPDILPAGSVAIEAVWIDGAPYRDFDAEALTVKLPASSDRLRVKVRLAPTRGLEHFTVEVDAATVTVSGDLDARAVHVFRDALAEAVAAGPSQVVIEMSDLATISREGARTIMLERQKMDLDGEMILRGACQAVRDVLDQDELTEELTIE